MCLIVELKMWHLIANRTKEKAFFLSVQAGISGGGSLPPYVDKFFEVRFSCILCSLSRNLNLSSFLF